MGRPVTLPTPPWEEAKPKPLKKKRYGPGNFPRNTPWVERYWRRKKLTDAQYGAAIRLLCAYRQANSGYAQSNYRERVDGGQAQGIEDAIDKGALYRELSQTVPPEYWSYVRHVVIDDKSLWSMAGCSGGANLNRYLKRLRMGLDRNE